MMLNRMIEIDQSHTHTSKGGFAKASNDQVTL